MPRWLAAAFILLLLWVVFAGLISLVVPLIVGKIYELSSLDLRSALDGVQGPLESLQNYISTIFALPESHTSISEVMVSSLRRFLNYDTVNSVVSSIINMGMSVVVVIFSVSFITFFFLKEDGLFYSMVTAMFPERLQQNVTRALDSITYLLSRYFTGLLTESLILMVVISTVLILFGMKTDNALMVGLIMGVMNVIPYAGPLIGGVISAFMGIVTPIEGYTAIASVVIICCTLFCIKGFDDFVLQPTIYSERVKAHPMEVFLVILLAGYMAGIVGMLLAIPSYTVLRVLAKEFFSEFSLVQKLTQNI
jgi:predicted PurR-regulated permease PerM